jgi:hypothetical protein
MQNPRLHCKTFLHLIPEPEEKASELLHDLIANDNICVHSFVSMYVMLVSLLFNIVSNCLLGYVKPGASSDAIETPAQVRRSPRLLNK